MDDQPAVRHETMIVLSIVLLVVFGIATGAAVYDYHEHQRIRHVPNLGFYPDGTENHEVMARRRLDATGVWDQSVPLWMRQERARELGYDPPDR